MLDNCVCLVICRIFYFKIFKFGFQNDLSGNPSVSKRPNGYVLYGSTLFVKVISRWLLARKELSDWLIDIK